MIIKNPIAISLSPNVESEDICCAIRMLSSPWYWKKGNQIKNVEEWFKEYFGAEEAVSFSSGRVALYALLKAFGIGKDDEVIIQAFTCVVVPNAIMSVGAKPIFADIDDSINIDPSLLERYINKKTKAIIVQHTFGIPAKIDSIKKIAAKYSLVLIEDCAQALGATINNRSVGTFGDASFFSFGRDKVISSVFGGMAIVNLKSNKITLRLKEIQKGFPYPSYFWIFQQLLHPLAFAVILPLYNFCIGKLFLFTLQKMHFLSKPVFKEELLGNMSANLLTRYPNALANLLIPQIHKLERYNKKRKEIASYYFRSLGCLQNIKLPLRQDGAIYLRFNLLINGSEEVLARAKKNYMLFGSWYKNIIDPKETVFEKIGYHRGSCPKAEKIAELSVNLPTYSKLLLYDLEKIVNFIKDRKEKE